MSPEMELLLSNHYICAQRYLFVRVATQRPHKGHTAHIVHPVIMPSQAALNSQAIFGDHLPSTRRGSTSFAISGKRVANHKPGFSDSFGTVVKPI